MNEQNSDGASVTNTLLRLSLLTSAGAILYTGIPLLANAWGAPLWVTPPTDASFAVWLAAVVASTRLAEDAWMRKQTFRFTVAIIGMFLWAGMLFLLTSYCPPPDAP